MALQSTVNALQGFGVVGAFYDNSPRRVNAMIVSGGADVSAVAATLTAVCAGDVPDDGDLLTIGGRVYRWKTTLAAVDDVQIGASITASMLSLSKTLNGTGTAGTDNYTGTTINTQVSSTVSVGTLVMTARFPGLVGNTILVTNNATEITLSAGALSGGAEAIDYSAYVGRAFTYDATNRNKAVIGIPASGAFAGILVNAKNQTNTGLNATLLVADGMQGDLCTMGHIVVQPANSVTVGMSGYFNNLTGVISGYAGVGAQTGHTLIANSMFVKVDSTATTGLAVLSITNA